MATDAFALLSFPSRKYPGVQVAMKVRRCQQPSDLAKTVPVSTHFGITPHLSIGETRGKLVTQHTRHPRARCHRGVLHEERFLCVIVAHVGIRNDIYLRAQQHGESRQLLRKLHSRLPPIVLGAMRGHTPQLQPPCVIHSIALDAVLCLPRHVYFSGASCDF
jgi:hypothetical protein